MKWFKYWVRMLFLLSVLYACARQEERASARLQAETASVTIRPEVALLQYATRSASVRDESGIADINLFLYRNGRLEWQEYRTSGEPVVLDLLVGERYSLYAVANAGLRRAPDRESDIHRYLLDFGTGVFEGKIPMASTAGQTFTVLAAPPSGGVPSGNEIRVELVRLAAKYHFRVDLSGLRYGSFSVESVRVRQAARSIDVFAPESHALAASDVSDGDYASEDDLAALNHASPVSFYMLENRQGTLLPGNTDPWRKEYFEPAISPSSGLSTFLEVKGHYRDHSGGLDATHTYRMYLGQDATTNFDVTRNTEYTLTLVISDLGAYRESWKVERGDVEDRRRLYFDPAVVDIASLGTGQTRVVSAPSGVDFHLEWDAAAFGAASLGDPALSGDRVSLTNVAELDEDATLYLRALSFDGAVEAVCTLLVHAGALPELGVIWQGAAPSYVAQAGRVHCSNVFATSVLTASVSDPSVARLVRQGDDFRVETLREGTTTLLFTRTDGTRTSTRTLDLSVSPVYLQVPGQRYLAFADGASNALRLDGPGGETWSMSYDLPRSSFDPALYAELLAPQYTAVKVGAGTAADWFDIDEEGLYVSRWGNTPDALPGTYQLSLSPRANIYAGNSVPLTRTVRIDEPVSLSSGNLFEGENRYYMPDRGERMEIVSSGTGALNLGDPANLRLCIASSALGYGEGDGHAACPYELVAAPGGNGSVLLLKPSYEDIVRNFHAPYRFRGEGLYVFARIANVRSGENFDLRLSRVAIWLDLAVTSKLASWSSHSGWDITDDDHYFLIPCLYGEDFETGMTTFNASEAGGGGDLGLPPFYIPRTILTGIPSHSLLDTRILLSEAYPSALPYPAYLDWQLSDRSVGLRCPDITNWLWDEGSFSADDYERDSYRELAGRVGSWYHKKLYWHLYRSQDGTVLPDGDHLDIKDYGGYSGNYYLRIYDYAEPLDVSDFDE